MAGATGTGKSTLMTCFLGHDMYHRRPAVVIDPKSSIKLISDLRALATRFGRDPKKLRVFSLSRPKESCYYNPIKHGTAIEKKDRIMGALEWSEQYYEALAGRYLSVILPIFECIGSLPTLAKLRNILIHREWQALMRSKLTAASDQLVNATNLLRELDDVLKIGRDKLEGLASQIGILDNPSNGHLLSPPDDCSNEIDLREIRTKGEIAYFQLNTLASGDTARRIGRMITEDLKAYCNAVFNDETASREFFPLYFDEFGAFATIQFIELLKQGGEAGFAVHLFCQGLEDLDAVTEVFRRQSSSNPQTKVFLRIDDPKGVNEITSMIGTVDSLEQSHQVESGLGFRSKTGLGNLRETKSMRVEHDVIKRLNRGQAILIEKSPSREDLVQLWKII